MHAWEAIEGALDFIEEHLQEDISTEALAQSAGLSPFYFQRLFKRLTGRPVFRYEGIFESCQWLYGARLYRGL